jgi:hypothetical protein
VPLQRSALPRSWRSPTRPWPRTSRVIRGTTPLSRSTSSRIRTCPTRCTSGGTQATGFGKATKKPLSPTLKNELYQQAGDDAALLEDISTSSQYGAPQKTLRNKKKGGGKVVAIPKETEDTSATKALSAVRTVVTDGSEGRLIALLVVLLAITGFAVAAAGYRQRALRRPIGR